MHSAFPFTDPLPSASSSGFRIITIAAICASIVGCRSGKPSGSMVQVTEDPAAIVADLPAPEQRLATTTASGKTTASKPLTGKEKTVNLVNSVAGMPDIFREKPVESPSPTPVVNDDSATQLSLSDSATQLRLSDSDAQHPAGAKSKTTAPVQSIAAQAANSQDNQQPSKSTPSVARQSSPRAAKTVSDEPDQDKNKETQAAPPASVADAKVELETDGLVSASLTDLTVSAEPDSKPMAAVKVEADKTETVAALPTEGPRVASSALETDLDLVASKTGKRPPVRRSSVSQTDQPEGLTQALEQSLSGLPSLPTVKPNSTGKVPTRIGTVAPAVRE